MFEFECRYCKSVVEQADNCSNCGGPKPKRLQPEVVERIVREYVFVSQPSTPSVYIPPRRSPLARAYNTFGFKVVTFVFVLILAALISSFVYWLSYRVSAPKATDPSYQLMLPTAVPTATQAQELDPWKDEEWLSAEEARELRTQPDVVNLAYLEKGGALYSANHSITLTHQDPWQRAKPLGMTELTVTATSVQLKARGYKYTLSVLQPFVLASQPTKVIVIDAKGGMWQADLKSLTIDSISNVVSELTIDIAPNPNLSFTY